jgi:chromate transporter
MKDLSFRQLKETAYLFLKLGTIGFGGPVAHIAMMEAEIVTKRKWMTRDFFMDMVGSINLIPGPNSTQMAIMCGYYYAGWAGLIVAGICFILPAVIITGFFAFLYVKFGSLPAVGLFLYGIKPAVIAIILSAIYKLGAKALKSWQLGFLGFAVIIATLLGLNAITAILAAGLLGMTWMNLERMSKDKKIRAFAPGVLLLAASTTVPKASLLKLFLIFLKVGSILFGGGYVLIAYLDSELVNKFGWLTRRELLDAIAVGQFTPGPVLSTATFIGYQIMGVWGAIVATLGIFLPSFFLVLLLYPIIPKLRKSPWTAAFLDAVNIGAVGIMLAVTVKLGREVLVDWKTWGIAVCCAFLVFYLKKMNTGLIVLMGAVFGFLLSKI